MTDKPGIPTTPSSIPEQLAAEAAMPHGSGDKGLQPDPAGLGDPGAPGAAAGDFTLRPDPHGRHDPLPQGASSLSACGGLPGTGASATPTQPEPSRPIRYMPLGDSITDGYPGEQGGYRTLLWQLLVQRDGDKIDFVGSLSGGPPAASSSAARSTSWAGPSAVTSAAAPGWVLPCM